MREEGRCGARCEEERTLPGFADHCGHELRVGTLLRFGLQLCERPGESRLGRDRVVRVAADHEVFFPRLDEAGALQRLHPACEHGLVEIAEDLRLHLAEGHDAVSRDLEEREPVTEQPRPTGHELVVARRTAG